MTSRDKPAVPTQRPKATPTAVEAEPLRLIEDMDTGDRLLIYAGKDGVNVDLRVADDTFWVTQQQMADLFGVTRPNITQHLQNIFREEELEEAAVCKESLHTGSDGKRYRTKFYDLNATISVGYRIGGKLGTMFRVWATDKIVQLLTKGFVIDDERLKNPDGRPDFFGELLDRIRDIRSSEARMWTRVLELCSFCNDYNADDHQQHVAFFAEVQNTMHWAVSQQTAAEIIHDRVDAKKENAGLMHFAGRMPTVKEAQTAKNFLGQGEITALNVITSLVLEFFESQAEQRRPTTLAQFADKMRELVKLDGRPVKQASYAGKISRRKADDKASEQIRLFKERKRIEAEATGEQALKKIADAVKGQRKPGSRKKPST